VYRVDGGKEYSGQKLVQHLKEHGMLSEITTPYTPEQNGVVERTMRTIFGKVRSAIEDSNLLQELWPEILLGAVHITNCTATSSLDKITPAEAFKR
jgi:transposase InsO family protein